MKKFILSLIIVPALLFSFMPTSLVAQSCDPSVEGDPCTDPVRISNPLGDTDTIWGLVDIVINLIQTVMIPLVVLFFIYAGFLFVTARGNETKLTKAKTVLKTTLIGAAIIIGAEAISLLIQGTVDQLRTGV